MKTAQFLKLVLVVAILFALFQLVTGRRFRRRSDPVGYSFENFEDSDYGHGEEHDDDSDAEEDSDDDDADSDAEDDTDDDDDSDAEDDSDDEEDEDEDAEDDESMEMYSNAMPTPQWDYGVPLMNVATDLLPKNTPTTQAFGEFAPKSLLGQNFLDAKKYIGVDTQGSSLRNANYDLRSSPSIPRRDIGPWFQSTIEGDLFRKPLE